MNYSETPRLQKQRKCSFQHSYNFFAINFVFLFALIFSANAGGEFTKNENPFVGIVLIILVIFQTLLIIGLQRSRLQNKRAKKTLRESKKALEERIEERTESLHKINHLLIDEVTRHESTGSQLRDTKEYLQSMINSMPSIIIGVSSDGMVTHWNAAAENTFEIFSNDALGNNIISLLPQLPITTDTISSSIREGEPVSLQHSQRDAQETPLYFDITIYPLISLSKQGAVIRIDDVTLRVTIENMMIQNEKMYSLGEVAAGIAHEINNPLSVILQNVQNIIRRVNPEFPTNQQVATDLGINIEQIESYLKTREIYGLLDSIRDAGERSATIVTNMLEFSHTSNRNISLVDIKKLIEQTITINTNIYYTKENNYPKIIVEIAESLPLIKCSGPEIQQVLLNLLRNAKQALQGNTVQRTDPTIWVRSYTQQDQLVIDIKDNGPGIPDPVKNHIFEPFYTTKNADAGTGLGLSISYFIITERHQGSIEVKSMLGKGSTFTIKLPIN